MSVLTILKGVAKYLALVVLALLLVLAAAIPLARWETPDDLIPVDRRQALAIDNVHLLTMETDQALMGRQLLIRDGLIEAIRASGTPVGAEYRVIDANGAYLMPGLFDMHVHAMDRKYLALSLAYGVTSVRNMGGYPMHLRWKQELARDEWLGSDLFTATPTLNGKKNSNPLAHKVVTEAGAARALIRDYHAQGYDFVKVYTRLDVPVFEAIIEEAGRLDFPVAGHVPYSVVKADYRLAAPMVTLEHTEEIFQGPLEYEYDDEAVVAIAEELRDMNATVTPTLMIFDHLTGIAREKQSFVDQIPLQYLNPLMKAFEDRTSGARWLGASDKLGESLEKRNAYFQHITRVLHETGVPLVLGSDCGVIYAVPGLSTHREIALLQQAGLPPHEILKTATVNAARVLGVEGRLGSIAPGKVADLVMTRDDPSTHPVTLSAPLAVVKGGQWLDESDLERLKQSAENPSNVYYTLGRMLEFVIFG